MLLWTDKLLEWASGDVAAKAEWSYGSTLDGINYHKVWKQDQQVFNEFNDRAQWGNVVSKLFGTFANLLILSVLRHRLCQRPYLPVRC